MEDRGRPSIRAGFRAPLAAVCAEPGRAEPGLRPGLLVNIGDCCTAADLSRGRVFCSRERLGGGVQRLSPLRTLNQYGEAPRTWAAVGGADPTAHWQQCRQPSAYSAMTSCSQLAAAVVLGLAVGVASRHF